METVTIRQFVNEVYTNFESNYFFDESNQVGKEAIDASFTASRALQVAYGVFAAEEIKTELNSFFNDKKNDAWFKEKGITDEEKTALREDLASVNSGVIDFEFVYQSIIITERLYTW